MSWGMRTSTLTQTFLPGATASRPAARARIFSVSVCGVGMVGGLGRGTQCPIISGAGNSGRRLRFAPADRRRRARNVNGDLPRRRRDPRPVIVQPRVDDVVQLLLLLA